jgi:large subunit ribosomal protein L23
MINVVVDKRLYSILLSPCVTNKSCYISEKFSYVAFKVLKNSTKKEIKKAVEVLFNVKVLMVKTLNVKGTSRVFKGTSGKTKSWKKAYVRLEPGHGINFVDPVE